MHKHHPFAPGVIQHSTRPGRLVRLTQWLRRLPMLALWLMAITALATLAVLAACMFALGLTGLELIDGVRAL